jgi:hypothetical protein
MSCAHNVIAHLALGVDVLARFTRAYAFPNRIRRALSSQYARAHSSMPATILFGRPIACASRGFRVRIIGSAFTVVVSGGGSVSGVSSIVVARRRSLSMIASIIIIIMSVGSV